MKKLFFSLAKKNSQPEQLPPVSKINVCDYKGLSLLYSLETYLKKLEDIVGLPAAHFEALYVHPIRLMCLRLQHTPFVNHISNPLISLKLNAVVKGMKHRESFIMPAGVDPEDINHKKDLWRFATFYALITYNLGPWITSYRALYKTASNKFEVLNPFGQMPDAGAELKYERCQPSSAESSLIISPLIFQPSSIGWLLRDSAAFNAAIGTSINPFNQELIGKVVQYAYGLSPLKSINAACLTPVSQTEEVSDMHEDKLTKDSAPLPSCTFTAKDQGRDFLRYLQGYLATALNVGSTDILLSDPNTYGFKAPMIFQSFASTKGLDWKKVKNGFNKLSIHIIEKKGDHSNDLHTISGKNGKAQWLIIPRSEFPENTNVESESLEKSVFSFLAWLKKNLEQKKIPNSKEKPLCIPVKENLLLVSPGVFKFYSETKNSALAEMLETQLLSQGLHIKNNTSDFFHFTLGGKTIKAIKISKKHLPAEPV